MTARSAYVKQIMAAIIGPGRSLAWLYNMVDACFELQLTPTHFKTATFTDSGALWTPATGKSFRIMGYGIELSGDAAQASGGVIDVILEDDGEDIIGIAHSLYVPATPALLLGSYYVGKNLQHNGYLASGQDKVVSVNLSHALTGGKLRASVWGTEE